MDLEPELGSKIPIKLDSDTQIGRQSGLGFGPSSTDRSISRRHLSLRLVNDPIEGFRVGFKVIGKNPIWVCSVDGEHGRMYKEFEKGELRVGDKLSLSVKKPFFFVVKRSEEEEDGDEERKRVLSAIERREKRTLKRRREKAKEEVLESDDGEGIESVDVSHIDPVKEFGFLVKGHEFDKYSKKKIPGIKNWNWFLKETSAVSDNDDDEDMIDEPSSSKGKKGRGIKKKKHGGADDDEEWAGDSEEENVVVVKGVSAKGAPMYSTRSKDSMRSRNDVPNKDSKVCEDEFEDEDDEDETLGGFIVDEEEVEEEVAEGEESEEEFSDDEEEELQ